MEGPVCEACGLEVSRAEAMVGAQRGLVVCRRGECQGLMAQRATMDPASYKVHFERRSRMIRDRVARDARREAHIAAVDAAEAQDTEKIVKRTRQALGEDGRLTAVVIPSGLSRIEPPSPERVARYKAHLETAIAEALEYPDTDSMPADKFTGARDRNRRNEALLGDNPELGRRSELACSLCKGGCCTTGEEHAYISAFGVRRLLDADPELTPEAILETYMRHVPDRGIADACINQGPQGCTLPRSLRSDVCNGFFCDPMVTFHKEWVEGEAPPTLFIRRAHHVWNRYATPTLNAAVEVALVDGSGVRTLDVTGDHHPAATDRG